MRRLQDERGLASIVAMLFVWPLAFLLVMLAVQAAVAARTNQVAAHAAQEAARAARTRNGTPADGYAAARKVLATLSPGVLRSPTITVTRTGDLARVEIRGTAMSVVPGFHPAVYQVSEGKVERFREEGRGRAAGSCLAGGCGR